MMITLAGAMSTAELGLSLAEMIRQDKVHLIVCTGANLEEDIFNLVAHDFYERVPHYRDLTPAGRAGPAGAPHEPRDRHLHPGDGGHAPHGEGHAGGLDRGGPGRASAIFPHEFFQQVLQSGDAAAVLPDRPEGTPGCWRPCEKKVPIVVPGWEDSTLGNMYAAAVIRGEVKNVHTVRTGIEYMTWLAEHYQEVTEQAAPGHVPDRRRHRRRLPHLRGAHAAPGPGADHGARSGATSARSATPPPATAPTPAPCPTRRSPGASWASTRRSTSSRATPPSWRR